MPSISISTSLLLPQVAARPRIKEYFSDLFTEPTAGFSVRILNRNHDGSLFQIRRNADDVEVIVLADFNDEISLNSLVQNVNEGLGDTLAGNLGEFVGASGFNNPDGLASADDAFVVIWFEQFFSNHASQSTASAQPQIVNAGTVVKENGKPALDFDGIDDYFQSPNDTIGSTNNLFVFAVGSILEGDNKSIVAGSNGSYTTATTVTWFVIRRLNGVFQTIISKDDINYINDFTFENNNFNLFNLSYSSGSLFESSVNNSVITGTSFSKTLDLTAEVDIRVIDNSGDKILHSLGRTSELIIYTTDQSANCYDIKNNINNYYSVY